MRGSAERGSAEGPRTAVAAARTHGRTSQKAGPCSAKRTQANVQCRIQGKPSPAHTALVSSSGTPVLQLAGLTHCATAAAQAKGDHRLWEVADLSATRAHVAQGTIMMPWVHYARHQDTIARSISRPKGAGWHSGTSGRATWALTSKLAHDFLQPASYPTPCSRAQEGLR